MFFVISTTDFTKNVLNQLKKKLFTGGIEFNIFNSFFLSIPSLWYKNLDLESDLLYWGFLYVISYSYVTGVITGAAKQGTNLFYQNTYPYSQINIGFDNIPVGVKLSAHLNWPIIFVFFQNTSCVKELVYSWSNIIRSKEDYNYICIVLQKVNIADFMISLVNWILKSTKVIRKILLEWKWMYGFQCHSSESVKSTFSMTFVSLYNRST